MSRELFGDICLLIVIAGVMEFTVALWLFLFWRSLAGESMSDNRDETTRPSEPYPLDVGDQVAALRAQRDAADARIDALVAERMQLRDLLAAWRLAAHEMQFGSHLIDRTTALLGDHRSIWYEQSHPSVPIQGGG